MINLLKYFIIFKLKIEGQSFIILYLLTFIEYRFSNLSFFKNILIIFLFISVIFRFISSYLLLILCLIEHIKDFLKK
jgi:hypothetical protein